jgi:hypothetical protein
VLFIGALGLGVWRHYQQHREVTNTAEQQADFVPSVLVETVAQRLGTLHVTLRGTTLGFEEGNIYGRASGDIAHEQDAPGTASLSKRDPLARPPAAQLLRKLAVIMHRIWSDQSEYRWTALPPTAA